LHVLWQARNVPSVREAAALAAQLAPSQPSSQPAPLAPSQPSSQPAPLAGPQPGTASAPSHSHRPSAGNVVSPERTGGLAPPAQAGGGGWAANGAARAGSAAEERPTAAVLTQLQRDVSELLAANQKLRQENIQMLREIFPSGPAV